MGSGEWSWNGGVSLFVVSRGLKRCEKGMLLRKKKQSFMNSVIEILLKVKNNHRSKFFFEILLIRNSSFTLLLK